MMAFRLRDVMVFRVLMRVYFIFRVFMRGYWVFRVLKLSVLATTLYPLLFTKEGR